MLLNMYHNDLTKPTLEKGRNTEMYGLSVSDKRFISLVEDGTNYHKLLPLRNPGLNFQNPSNESVKLSG